MFGSYDTYEFSSVIDHIYQATPYVEEAASNGERVHLVGPVELELEILPGVRRVLHDPLAELFHVAISRSVADDGQFLIQLRSMLGAELGGLLAGNCAGACSYSERERS